MHYHSTIEGEVTCPDCEQFDEDGFSTPLARVRVVVYSGPIDEPQPAVQYPPCPHCGRDMDTPAS